MSRATVTLDGLPLGDLPAFGERSVRGDLRGKASLEGLKVRPCASSGTPTLRTFETSRPSR